MAMLSYPINPKLNQTALF